MLSSRQYAQRSSQQPLIVILLLFSECVAHQLHFQLCLVCDNIRNKLSCSPTIDSYWLRFGSTRHFLEGSVLAKLLWLAHKNRKTKLTITNADMTLESGFQHKCPSTFLSSCMVYQLPLCLQVLSDAGKD